MTTVAPFKKSVRVKSFATSPPKKDVFTKNNIVVASIFIFACVCMFNVLGHQDASRRRLPTTNDAALSVTDWKGKKYDYIGDFQVRGNMWGNLDRSLFLGEEGLLFCEKNTQGEIALYKPAKPNSNNSDAHITFAKMPTLNTLWKKPSGWFWYRLTPTILLRGASYESGYWQWTQWSHDSNVEIRTAFGDFFNHKRRLANGKKADDDDKFMEDGVPRTWQNIVKAWHMLGGTSCLTEGPLRLSCLL